MDKESIYEEALTKISALLEDEDDEIAGMSSICAVLKQSVHWATWVGFYRVVGPRMLAVGPYQGGIGCLRIPFDRGVCGAAATTAETQLVADVHAFPGHITCDSLARSEIVVPVLGAGGGVRAVLDLDSREPSAFDETDRFYLEKLAAAFRSSFE